MSDTNINISCSPKIGIFWLIIENGESRFLTDMISVEDGEEYGDSVTWSGHYDFWEKIRTQKKTPLVSRVPLWSEYEEWPRGRVIFNKNHNQFVVYADRKILTDMGKKEISLVFSLPSEQTVFRRDGHYVSIRQITI
ncbi:MAG: hypothetical protein LKG96_07745 [Acetobacter fabarum]|jgi:hypothetical protein|uniref:hypothetical protein n=1 Tax=Acetobacter fabarum TaxID=483199 RepID=UPI00242E6822|nr:hypothetical protein [Acetobacter fabarum]MCH4024851.1 hypothetical protein [Acetobacter fabarum]MCI1420149.1 hypothetical protein [Acetobacter fabarum]MCI1446911.1 hypothetical protein [Acetobacter fabarum]MCI1465597.1 hypothetical protein [Acetobacter fabarum]MCI1629356.1 hypothetical protein [Acetobacter fabarum]